MSRKIAALILVAMLAFPAFATVGPAAAQAGNDSPNIGDLDPIIYGSNDGDYTARINSITGGEEWQASTNRPASVSVDPGYELVAVATDGETLTVRNASDGSPVWTYSGYNGDILRAVNWGPQGEYLAIGTDDSFGDGGEVIVLNRTGSEVWRSQSHDGSAAVRSVRIDAQGEYVYSGGTDNLVIKHNLTTGDIVWNHSFGTGFGSPYGIAPGPEGDVVTFGTGPEKETILRQLDASDGTTEWTKTDYQDTITAVHHSQTGRIYYVSSSSIVPEADNFIGAVEKDGTDIFRRNLTDMGVTGRYSSTTGMTPLRSGGYAFGMRGKIITWHDNGSTAVLDQELTQGITGITVTPSQSVEGTLSLSLNGPRFMQLNSTEAYTVDLVATDPTDGTSTTIEVTNDSDTSVVSANVSVLEVNETTHTFNTSGTADNVNVTATYSGTLSDTQEVAVATSICALGPLERFTTVFQDLEFFALIIIVLPSVVLGRAVGALAGIAAIVLGMGIGWFSGFIGLPMFLIAVIGALFFGLNIGENMNYQGSVREERRQR